jgi:MFS family permease
VAALALAAAWKVVPAGETRGGPRVDVQGAALLALALGSALLALSEGSAWGWASGAVLALFAVAVLAGTSWAIYELRTSQPLVDLRLLRIRTVLTADVTVLLAGVGMYLLLSLTTRLAQAPRASGGLGQSVVVSGLLLVPMSAASLLATRLSRTALRRVPLTRRLPVAAAVMLAAMLMFTAARSDIWILALTMAVAGIGIGLIFAVTPELIVAAVPPDQTGSAMSFNQIFRYVGYSIGSALSTTILQANTSPGAAFPTAQGYTMAGIAGCAMWIVTGLASMAAAGSQPAAPGLSGSGSPEPARLVSPSSVKGKLP